MLRKLQDDLDIVNRLLRASLKNLPQGSPSTPFTKNDSDLLHLLKDETLKSIIPAFNSVGVLHPGKAKQSFENSMQKRILFEKLGIEPGVQIMTIHKSKGREFDGVVLVFEDNMKALWRKESNTPDMELADLYRVAISRARNALCIIAYNDIYHDAKAAVQRLLPDNQYRH